MPEERETVPRRTTYAEVFAEPEFRVVVASNLLTLLAETLRILALSVLVFATTGSALLSAATFGAGFLPQAVGGSVLTALADKLPARRLLVGYELIAGAVTCLLAMMSLPVWAILALIAAAGSLAPLRMAAVGALLPEILAGDRYVLGRSVIQTGSYGMQIAGYATGGLLLALLTPRAALLAATAGYLVSAAVWQLRLHKRPAPAPELPLRATAVETLRANNLLLRVDRQVRGLLLAHWLPVACVTGAEATLVAYAAQARLPAGSAGYLLTAMPVGMILGDVLVARLCRPAVRARLAFPLALLTAVPLLAFAVRPRLVVAIILLSAAGAGSAYLLPLQATFVETVGANLRGRAFGLLGSGLMTAQGVGTVVVGALASLWGPASAIVAAGGITGTCVVLLRRPLAPQRLLPPPEPAHRTGG